MNKYDNIPTDFAKHYTNDKYLTPPHIQLIEKKLLDVFHGKIKRLLISLPPRHGKSELISKFFPPWYLLNKPPSKIIITSYNQSKAMRFRSQDIYKTYRNDLKVERADFYQNSKDGFVSSSGTRGSLTGDGADLLIIDDPYKNHIEAYSATIRESIWDWFKSTAYTRMQPDGRIIIIHTRWHYDDLIGKLINDPEWEYLRLPAIAEENDILNRKIGDPLWSEKYGISELTNIKETIGSFWFSAMYQQNPIASEYQIFKTDKWKFYKEPPSSNAIFQVWDTAFKTGQENDFSVCETWSIVGKDFYLLNVWRGKVQFPDLEIIAKSQYDYWKPRLILIEDAASGQDLIPVLRKDTRLPIKAVAGMNKVIRAHAVSPIIEQGRVYLPEEASWLPDFLNEHSQFPYGKHDDMVDGTTIFLDFAKNINAGSGTIQKSTAERKTKKINKFQNY